LTSSSVETSLSQVTLVAHADWSKNPSKRWMAVASLHSDHIWRLNAPIKAENPSNFFFHLKSLQAIPGCILVGFDFPIGLPYHYAKLAGITDFLSTLPYLGQEQWGQFFSPAQSVVDLSIFRPFYPDKPGASRRAHLEDALGIPFVNLYRLCEAAHNNRRAACPLFWTLGGQQVGKAAISGWRDLLIPALSTPQLHLKIWPFSGTLPECCQSDNVVVVETYPTEFYGHLGLFSPSHPKKSKRRQIDRQSFNDHLISWATSHQLDLDNDLKNSINDGFGKALDGEDRFDAVIGLYGMINIVLGNHPVQEPDNPVIRKIEGWIFGEIESEGDMGVRQSKP
jgi:hypothetical protein